MLNTIYTIGHSTHKTDYFLNLLKSENIQVVLDVRSVPYSKYASAYNRENIKKFLEGNGIRYFFGGSTFGARPKDPDLYTDRIVDFEKVSNSNKFLEGLQIIKGAIKKNNVVCLMCTEKNPSECHRSVLLGKAVKGLGISIVHILENGDTINQEELENSWLEKYFPNRRAVSLVKTESRDYLSEVYKIKNQEIGYRRK